jgi:hypothetical protein
MDKKRELAASIIDLFEDLLEEYGIDIPNEDRDMEMEDMTPEEIENAGLAHIYGDSYYYLEDAIVELLSE